MIARFLVTAALLMATTAHAADADPVAAAVAARQAGRFEDAQTLLLAHLTKVPDDARALHELGVLFALHGQYREAVAKFQAALALQDSAETRRSLAEVMRADNRCGEALPQYKALIAADLGDHTGWRGLVLCEQQMGRTDAALQAAADVEARFAGTEFAAWAHARAEQIRAIQAAGTLTPQQVDAEGEALFRERRFADAAVWLAKALEMQATADRAYRLAMALLGTGDVLAAQGALSQALKLDAAHVPTLSAWPTVTRALRVQGRGATDVDLRHQDRMPAQMVARALAEGDVTLARQLLDSALKSAKAGTAAAKGAVLAVLDGEVRLREGKLAEAAAAFDEAQKLRPGYPAARKGLAAVYVLQGRDKEARELAGLPPHAERDDLLRFVPLRRAELMHQLAMADDPGLKPLPALLDQIADHAPPPPPEPVPPPPAAPAPSAKRAVAKPRGTKK